MRERIRFLCRASLLIIDEIGYLTVGSPAGNLFFQLVNARYEKGAMILTSNRGFAEWGEVFGDPVASQPRCSTDFFTTPSSCISRAPATAAPTRRPRPGSHAPDRSPIRRGGADGHRKTVRVTLRSSPWFSTRRRRRRSWHALRPDRSQRPTARRSGQGMKPACGGRVSARPLTAPSTVAIPYPDSSDTSNESGEFYSGTFGEFSTGIDRRRSSPTIRSDTRSAAQINVLRAMEPSCPGTSAMRS